MVEHPAGIPATFGDHAKLMFDLQVLAYQCDLTRVITFMIGREFSGRPIREVGVPDAHHPVTHHQGDAEKMAKVLKDQRFHASCSAYFLDRLRATPDGDGTLLDHVTLIYGTGLDQRQQRAPRYEPADPAHRRRRAAAQGRPTSALSRGTPLANSAPHAARQVRRAPRGSPRRQHRARGRPSARAAIMFDVITILFSHRKSAR